MPINEHSRMESIWRKNDEIKLTNSFIKNSYHSNIKPNKMQSLNRSYDYYNRSHFPRNNPPNNKKKFLDFLFEKVLKKMIFNFTKLK